MPETNPKPPKMKIPKSHSQKEKERMDRFNKRIMNAVAEQFERNRLPRPPAKVEK